METTVYNNQGQEIGKIKLPEEIFGLQMNQPLVWEAVNAFLKNQRTGQAKAKTRGEVRGGGKKPWRQKGIGRARQGSIRSPIWRGGGVVFGPRPRDYSVRFPKKKKLKALMHCLSALAKEGRIKVIEELKFDTPKTKNFIAILNGLQLNQKKSLFAVERMDDNLKLAGRNIPYLTLKRADDLNCYDLLSNEYLIITKNGLEKLNKRCVTKKL